MAFRGKDAGLTEITNNNIGVDKKRDIKRVIYVYNNDLISVCDQLPKVAHRVYFTCLIIIMSNLYFQNDKIIRRGGGRSLSGGGGQLPQMFGTPNVAPTSDQPGQVQTAEYLGFGGIDSRNR